MPSPSAPAARAHCVLVVDDNRANLALAAALLEATAEWTVHTAEDAEQALAMLDETRPDLILMDIGLPGMDGLTLTRKLKADSRWQHVPIIALTAFAMEGDERKALAAGCSGYIAKPINTRTFQQQVAAMLQHSVGDR